MASKKTKGPESKVDQVDNPEEVEETLVIRQRLRNLCQLAIEIGLKTGLIGNHHATETEGGQNVVRERIVRHRKPTTPGENLAGNEGRSE